MKNKVVITSGYFNPLHIGHINLFKGAKEKGDWLVVIVNNDKQVKIKGSIPFMNEKERVKIIKAIRYVDEVFLSIDKDRAVAKSLEKVAKKFKDSQLFFAKGGDRNVHNIPESEKKVCQKYDIKILNNIGGKKIQSSSELLKNILYNKSYER